MVEKLPGILIMIFVISGTIFFAFSNQISSSNSDTLQRSILIQSKANQVCAFFYSVANFNTSTGLFSIQNEIFVTDLIDKYGTEYTIDNLITELELKLNQSEIQYFQLCNEYVKDSNEVFNMYNPTGSNFYFNLGLIFNLAALITGAFLLIRNR